MPNEKEKIKGKAEQWEGKLKEEAGKLGGDTSREVGGMVEQGRGKLREKLADAQTTGVDHREPKDIED
jgi:uncharacterized protein YjbJ (UPF0337 family)